MKNILIFGASVTWGAWDPSGGWAQRLRKFIDENNIEKNRILNNDKIFTYDLGIPGDTTEGLLERFESETGQRIDEGDETIFIFSIGINDFLFNNKTKNLDSPPNKFQENLEKLFNLAKKYSDKIIFVGSLPVDEEKVDPVPWLPTHSYKNEFVKEYNQISQSVCRLSGANFIGIYEDFIDKDYQKLLEDGIHPNSAGHQIIYEKVRDFLENNKKINL